MILYDKYSNFLGMSPKMLSFLGFEDLDEFKAIYKDVADLFVEKKGYIYKFKNFSWIEYTLHSGTPNKNVLITLKNSQVIESELKITEIYLANEVNNCDKFYIVEFLNGFFNNKQDENLSSLAIQTSSENAEAMNLLQTSKEKYQKEEEEKTLEKEPVSISDTFIENKPEIEQDENRLIPESELSQNDFPQSEFDKLKEEEEDFNSILKENEEETPQIAIKDEEEDFFSKFQESENKEEVQSPKEFLPENEEEKIEILENIFKEEEPEKEKKEEKEENYEEDLLPFENETIEEEPFKKQEETEKIELFEEIFKEENEKEEDFFSFDIKEESWEKEENANQPSFEIFEEKEEKETIEESQFLPFSPKEEEPLQEISEEEDFFSKKENETDLLAIEKVLEKENETFPENKEEISPKELLPEKEEKEEEKIENIFEHLEIKKEENKTPFGEIKKDSFFGFLKKPASKDEEISKNIGKHFKLKKEIKKKKEKTFHINVKESFESLGISQEEEKELIKDFINDIKKNILLIQKYLSNKDYSKIDDILNIIKSAASILNIKEIVQKIDKMHSLLKEDEIDKFLEYTKEINLYVENMEKSIFQDSK